MPHPNGCGIPIHNPRFAMQVSGHPYEYKGIESRCHPGEYRRIEKGKALAFAPCLAL